jgi:hypothetical protein
VGAETGACHVGGRVCAARFLFSCQAGAAYVLASVYCSPFAVTSSWMSDEDLMELQRELVLYRNPYPIGDPVKL